MSVDYNTLSGDVGRRIAQCRKQRGLTQEQAVENARILTGRI